MKKELFLDKFYIPETTLPFTIGLFTERACSPHWHHYWEILYQVEGETAIRVGGEEYHSKVGDVTIIGADEIHATEKLSRRHTILVMQFELSAILPYIGTISEYQYLTNILFNHLETKAHFRITEENSHLQELLRKTFEEYEQKQIGYEIQIQAFLLQMFAFFLRNEYLQFPEIPEERRQALEKVKESILYVEKNFSSNITLEKVAEVSSISIYNFCRTFKKATERTFVEYLNYIRLREAEKMLLTTDKSISDIAYDIGFSSVSYFNKMFKKKYGYPPFLYKKQNAPITEKRNDKKNADRRRTE